MAEQPDVGGGAQEDGRVDREAEVHRPEQHERHDHDAEADERRDGCLEGGQQGDRRASHSSGSLSRGGGAQPTATCGVDRMPVGVDRVAGVDHRGVAERGIGISGR